MQKRTLLVNEDTGSFSNQRSYDEMSSVIDQETLKRKISEEQDFSESETEMQLPKKPLNGKKTKGRVKIKMEFIDNKLRRYTTFSKRKTGIMKKAYELSTLTGTQVMVLVASETGHVYTFATRKLQPMITSEAGKSLIQTCLNSPDPLLEASTSSPDQRMSAAGYEETELSYNVDDSDNKAGMKTFFVSQNGSTPLSGASVQSVAVSPAVGGPITSLPSPLPSNLTAIPLFTSSALGTNSNNNSNNNNNNNNNKVPTTPPAISMQLPQSGFTTILTPGAALPQASTLQIGTLQSSPQNQISNNQQVSSSGQSPLLRISPASLVSLPVATTSSSKQIESSVTVVPSTRPNVSVMPGNMILPTSSITPTSTGVPNAVMYQAPQGVVYAPSSALPERVILNLSLQSDQGQQLYMPVPVSLTPAHQKVTGTLTAKVALASISSPLVAGKSQKCRK